MDQSVDDKNLTLRMKETIRKYAQHASGYDASADRTMKIRRETIDGLGLKRGDVVLDIACGTGLSFELILEKIGHEGRIVGIEISPEMAKKAIERVKENNWKNVEIQIGPVESSIIPRDSSAVLFNYTHDVLQSEVALLKIFEAIQDGAHVSISGMKLISGPLSIFNWYVYRLAKPYMSTFEGLNNPWSKIERFVPRLNIKETMLGSGYIAKGSFVR